MYCKIQYIVDSVIFFVEIFFFFLEDRCALYTFWCCTTRPVRSTFNPVWVKQILYWVNAYLVIITHVRSLCIIHLLVLHNCRVLSCSSYLFMCELLYFSTVCDCCAYTCLVFQFLFETVVLHTPFGVVQPWVSFILYLWCLCSIYSWFHWRLLCITECSWSNTALRFYCIVV